MPLTTVQGASMHRTKHILEHHSDEVWFVQFSHDGNLLATASKDRTAIIWDLQNLNTPYKRLCGHADSLTFLTWSPDDRCMLTCGNDRVLKLWLVHTGECVRTFIKHADTVIACAWLPDGKYFISAGIDKNVYLWSVDGIAIQSWHGPRVSDLVVIALRTTTLSGPELRDCTNLY
jgi:WD40 repeat protein